MEYRTRVARYLASAAAASLTAALLSVGSVAASNPQDLVVTGQSESTITLALTDASAAFGTNLTPNGQASDAEGVLVETVAAGSCYDWAGTVTISSNVIYDVEISSAAANDNLDWMTSDPADYTACTGGTQVAVATNDLVTAQAITATQAHNFWLGLDVTWSDGVSATLGDATLTFTGVANA